MSRQRPPCTGTQRLLGDLKAASRNGDSGTIQSLLSEWQRTEEAPLTAKHLEWALAAAIESGSRETVRMLLDNGAGPPTSIVVLSLCNDLREKPADDAVFAGMLDDLLDHGWDIDAGQPLMTAPVDGVLYSWLLAHGADANIEDEHGRSFLGRVARRGSLETVRHLLASGRVRMDSNALHMAVRRGKRDPERAAVIELLVEHGADVDARETGVDRRPRSSALRPNPLGKTPLAEARARKDAEVVALLVAMGADA